MMENNGWTDVVLVRHGIAVDIGEQGVRSDAERMLSKLGRVRTTQTARGLKAIGCAPAAILSSPLRRAVETAETVRDILGGAVEIRLTEALVPEAGPEEAVRAIAAAGSDCVLVVGHMPNLSCVTSWLLAGSGSVAIPFKKAGACGLRCMGRVGPGAACLQWALTPRMLRALAARAG